MKIRHLWRCCIACTALLSVQSPSYSQVSHPSEWEKFVQSPGNIAQKDTFRMQTFSGTNADYWKYATQGNCSIQELASLQIQGERGKQGLQMPMNASLNLEDFTTSIYQNVSICIHKGGEHLMPGEEIKANIIREGETISPELSIINKEDAKNPFSSTIIGRSPTHLQIFTPQAAPNTLNGHYYIDSVFAYGFIPSYSLFRGTGEWNDTLRWSHIPAERHRIALVKGDVSVSTEIQCDQISLGEGQIHIAPNGHLSTKTLMLYSNDQASGQTGVLRSSGVLQVDGKIILQKTFAQKGKWYFVSFPFDVYASGIDPNFQMGDNQKETNGDYFYVQSYNGNKRSASQTAVNNWEVVASTVMQTEQPVFKKNTGYLIAIDASAQQTTLQFASQSNAIPTDFGKQGVIDIAISTNSLNEKKEHEGWFLCGNPLPAPLVLNQLEPNPALDGYIYLYDGQDYHPYAIGSDFAIPPFAAFFVKANQSTRLTTRTSDALKSYQLLSNDQPLKSMNAEPHAYSGNPTSMEQTDLPNLRCVLNKGSLSIFHAPTDGKVEIFSTEGKMVENFRIPQGNTTLHHSLPQGIYLVIIHVNGKRTVEKISVNP